MEGSDRETPGLVIRLLGPFDVRLHGAPLPRLRSRKGPWLLALLALRHGREVERDWLAGTLWPDSTEHDAFVNVRQSLKDLRRALGREAGRLRSVTPHTLSLDLSGAEVDLLALDAALARGDTASLEEALSLYRGPLLEGCAEEWVLQEREVREQSYLTALERLAGHALAGGDATAAEGYLRRVVAAEPLRESAQRALMEALVSGGSYAAAIEVYRDLRLRLQQELNAEPDAETKTLYEQLREDARRRAREQGSDRARRRQSEQAKVMAGRSLAPSPGPGPTPSALPPRALVGGEGTVTFLFTDIEGSTRLWERDAQSTRAALGRHDERVRVAIEGHGGTVFKTLGDGFCAAFATAPEALAAAVEAQRALHQEAWGAIGPLRVRMALHTGAAEEREGDYFGLAVNRVARLLEAGHGGQILLSLTTAELTRDHLPEGAGLRDLGLHRLRDLQRPERVFQFLHPDLPADFPPLTSLDAFPNNLPQQVTSFIGRQQEIAEVKRLLESARLLTLTGTGGTGKTRLALQIAADVLQGYGDGVWLVELAGLADPALVPQSVARVLGVREQPGRPPTETLVEVLKAQKLLLVLDNCEHLLDACAALGEALVRGCPAVQILATSREGLNIPGETPYRLRSLAIPDLRHLAATLESLTQYEAVQLFIDRATTVAPSFAVTDQNARIVAEVCHRLDGIPLAIELAAVRVKAMPVEKIHERLDDRFRLLTGGSRTALPRQQTLRALIDWSYDLLSQAERAVLQRLSVFAGGWTLEAAEAVCGDDERPPTNDQRPTADTASGVRPSSFVVGWDEILDLLTSLVEKSLVGYEEQAGEGRYRLLETVRQYARDRLLEDREAEAVRRRHADYFLQLAERAEPELRGGEQRLWADRLEVEHDNLRAALTWFGSTEDGDEAQLRLTGVLWRFWFSRGHFREGRRWLEEALSRGRDATGPNRVKALLGAGHLAHLMGNYEVADTLLEESVALARAAGQKWDAAHSLFHWAQLAINQGEYARATALAQECLTLAREVGDPWLRALPLVSLGLAALHQDDSASARSCFEESLGVARTLGDRFHVARWTAFLGAVELHQGEWEQARALYREALMGCQEVADMRAIAGCLSGLATVAAQTQPERAARLFGAADALRQAMGAHRSLIDPPGYEHTVGAIRAQLDEQAFAAAWSEGRAMSLEQAFACASEGTVDSG